MAAPKRQTNTGGRVEDHDGNAIVVGQHIQSLVSGRRDPANVRLHTTADIQQEQDVDWHGLAGKISDGQNMPIHSQNKIVRLEPGYDAPISIDHLGIDAA
jgi:hypothetical protein